MNAENVVFDGKEYFDALINDIDHAKESIELEVYIFAEDHVGSRVAKALSLAKKRGVKVRLLIDGFGSPFWGRDLQQQLEKAGVEVKIYRPIPWHFWHWKKSVVRFPVLKKIFYLFQKMNHRNHRKVCIIDGKLAWAGSFNISKTHLPRTDGGKNWRDTAIRVQGNLSSLLKEAFENSWDCENYVPIEAPISKEPSNLIVRVFQNRKQRRLLYKDLLSRIQNADKRIWITNAYFIPEISLLNRLKNAALRGVDVKILLPHYSDVFFIPWASAVFYNDLLKSNVKIFEYNPGMLHAKTLIVDDFHTVGSSNLNFRSLLHDLEVDIVIQNEETKQKLEQKFTEDLQLSNEIGIHRRPLFNIVKRFLGRLLLYLRYWM